MTAMNVARFRKDPFRSALARDRAGRFGMGLFLATLAIIFLTMFIGALVIRTQLEQRGEWPNTLPRLPLETLLGTIVLVISSLAMHRGQRAAEQRRAAASTRLLTATFVLGALFLLVQSFAWWTWVQAVDAVWSDGEAYRFALAGFYVLTGLHALHVLGGLFALGWVGWRGASRTAGDDAERAYHASVVRLAAMYWHFLLLVWVGVYAILLMLQ